MGSTADKLNKLMETKAAIKTAIIGKGQSVSDFDTFASYADKIDAISVTASDDGAGNVTITIPGGNILIG